MNLPPLDRREMLCRSGLGFGSIALGSILSQTGLLGNTAQAAETPENVAAQREERLRCRPRSSKSSTSF